MPIPAVAGTCFSWKHSSINLSGIESMRPLLARTYFLGFLVLTSGIVHNALYSQRDNNSGVIRATNDRGGRPAVRLQMVNTTASVKPSGKQAVNKKAVNAGKPLESVEIVGAIQQELTSRGYHPGPPDGVAAMQTRAAVMAYEYDNGWQVTANPSGEFLRRLVFGPATGPAGKKAPLHFSPEARKIAMLVQKALAEHGYSPGDIDGVPGKATRNAIMTFERDRGLQQKGRISGRIIKEMNNILDLELAAAE